MRPFRPLIALFVLVVLLAPTASARAATPTTRHCKAVKAKKHKTKRDRVLVKKCAVAAKKSAATKPKAPPAPARPAAPAVPTAGNAATSAQAAPVAKATPTPVATATAVPTPVVPALPIGTGRAVQVRGFEFGLNLSRAEVLAGSVRVEFNLTSAEDPHTLVLARMDGTGPSFRFDEQASGTVGTKSLSLTSGRWQLVCDLPGHAEWGMKVNLEVR